MAAAIAICILSSAWLFGRIEPYVSDFTGYEQRTAVPAVAEASDGEETPEPTEQSETGETQPTQVPNQPTVAPATTTTTVAFEETHQSNPDFSVNFRPGPSIDSGDPVATLDPGTPLQYLDEQTTGDDGSIWLRMKTQDGIEGWLREVDTVPVA
jgi:SH3 domain-containing protein